jgi:UDP-N-acetylmuramyl pentapeptide synthase
MKIDKQTIIKHFVIKRTTKKKIINLSRNSRPKTVKEVKKISRDSIRKNSERIVGTTMRNLGKESKEEHVEDGK